MCVCVHALDCDKNMPSGPKQGRQRSPRAQASGCKQPSPHATASEPHESKLVGARHAGRVTPRGLSPTPGGPSTFTTFTSSHTHPRTHPHAPTHTLTHTHIPTHPPHAIKKTPHTHIPHLLQHRLQSGYVGLAGVVHSLAHWRVAGVGLGSEECVMCGCACGCEVEGEEGLHS